TGWPQGPCKPATVGARPPPISQPKPPLWPGPASIETQPLNAARKANAPAVRFMTSPLDPFASFGIGRPWIYSSKRGAELSSNSENFAYVVLSIHCVLSASCRVNFAQLTGLGSLPTKSARAKDAHAASSAPQAGRQSHRNHEATDRPVRS